MDKRVNPNKIDKRKRGRPKYVIDWSLVDELLEADCEGTEVAAYLGIAADTLYDRCVKENGVIFSAYLREKKAKGNTTLKQKQYETAMDGDKTMLIWLGKNRLNQRDKLDHDVSIQEYTVKLPDDQD